MTTYKKAQRTLDFVNLHEKTIKQRPINGYLFQGELKGGETIELFVYKIDGFWRVNDTAANGTITAACSTRKQATINATVLLRKVSAEQYEEKMQRILDIKKECSVIETEVIA